MTERQKNLGMKELTTTYENGRTLTQAVYYEDVDVADKKIYVSERVGWFDNAGLRVTPIDHMVKIVFNGKVLYERA